MWLVARPPDNPFDKAHYYYGYNIREAKAGERPPIYNSDASLKEQKAFIISFEAKIKVDNNNRIAIESDRSHIFSEWNLSHSKEIKRISKSYRHKIIESIFGKA